ncbi:MAG: sugar phosphate isomerase/epimerase [Acidobacteria bacterium]|nr:sugar phosphate isomerase/epimerase [Acidobacteriota bacterium]
MAQLTRREWHRLTLGGVAAAAAGILPGTARRAVSAQSESRFAGVLIGLQSYSFRDMSLDDGIAAMQQVGITSCELWEGHVEPAELRRPENRERLRRWRTTIPLDWFEEIRWQFEDAGIEINAYNLSFQDHFSDAEIDRGFEMAQMLGAPAITASAHMNSVPRIARYADRYGIPVAMHNHSRVDPNAFSSPDDFARAIEMGGRAPIAVNLDIGHMVAANHDPIAYLRGNYQRIVTLHLKDRERNDGPHTPWGEGDTPIRKTLLLLRDEGWDIPANIEYEYPGDDTVTEIGRCLEYCKDVLGA